LQLSWNRRLDTGSKKRVGRKDYLEFKVIQIIGEGKDEKKTPKGDFGFPECFKNLKRVVFTSIYVSYNIY